MKRLGIVWSIAAVVMLSGCSRKAARYQPPPAPALVDAKNWNTGLTAGEVPKATAEVALSHWWSVFADPELTSLEERALKANLDLRKAVAEIQQARANRDYSSANLFPSVTGTFGSTGTHTGGGGSSFGGGSEWSPQNSANLQASWEPDFFGGLRKNVASYEATAQAQQENLHNVMVTLTAEVAQDYISARSYQAQLEVTKKNLVEYKETYDMTVQKRDSGLATDLDVQQALETVESTEASIPSLDSSLQQSWNAISILLAQRPGSVDAEFVNVKAIPAIPAEVAVGIPADLIRRRPDIRQAERQYAAQWLQRGVAEANLYPTFSLSGTFAFSATNLLNVLDAKSLTSSIAGSVEQTLLNRRALHAQVRVQDAVLDQDELSYESTVLGAIQDVENALKSFGAEQERRKSLAGAADAAEQSAEMSRQLYAGGLKDFLTVLDSERTVLSAQNSLVQCDANVATDLVQLYKVMGGGWQ